MAQSYIPSLSTDGNIIDSNEIMAKLFEYYLASDKSQSNYFIRDVQSLKYTIDTEKVPTTIATAIKEDLSKLYKNYFDNGVTVSVTISNDENENSSVVYYKIDIKAYDSDNNLYELHRVVDDSLASTVNYETALTTLIEKYS